MKERPWDGDGCGWFLEGVSIRGVSIRIGHLGKQKVRTLVYIYIYRGVGAGTACDDLEIPRVLARNYHSQYC